MEYVNRDGTLVPFLFRFNASEYLQKDSEVDIMKINNQVHLIRKEFYVTPEVKRYINIYLIVGKYCYLVDSGVAGSHAIIEEYLKTINREMQDIKGIFLTHSHPDHIGAAAEIHRQTNCKIMLAQLRDAVFEVENKFQQGSESEKIHEVYKKANILKFSGNPLVAKSIEACQRLWK